MTISHQQDVLSLALISKDEVARLLLQSIPQDAFTNENYLALADGIIKVGTDRKALSDFTGIDLEEIYALSDLARPLELTLKAAVINLIEAHSDGDNQPCDGVFISAADMLAQPVEIKPLLGKIIEQGCTGQIFGPSIHHTGNDVENSHRSRGSSSLKAAMDFEILCNKGLLTYTKVKDGETPEPTEFKLMPVVIGSGEDGEPITSCVVSYGERSAKNKEVRLTNLETQLLELVNKHPGILSGDLRNLFNEQRKAREPGVENSALKKSFTRSLDGLISKNKVVMDGHKVTLGHGTLSGHLETLSSIGEGHLGTFPYKGCPDVPPMSQGKILTLSENDFVPEVSL